MLIQDLIHYFNFNKVVSPLEALGYLSKNKQKNGIVFPF